MLKVLSLLEDEQHQAFVVGSFKSPHAEVVADASLVPLDRGDMPFVLDEECAGASQLRGDKIQQGLVSFQHFLGRKAARQSYEPELVGKPSRLCSPRQRSTSRKSKSVSVALAASCRRVYGTFCPYHNRSFLEQARRPPDSKGLDPLPGLPLFGTPQGPMEGRDRNAKALGHLAERVPLVEQRLRAADVDRATWSADDGALSSSSLKARLRSFSEPNPLLLGDPSEDRDQQWPDRASGVEPRLFDADDLDPAAVEIENRLEVADHRAAEPIQRPDDDDVELATMGSLYHRVELGAGLRSARLLLKRGDLAKPPGS